MRLSLASMLVEGWAIVRRDRALLLPLAGLFWLLPGLALLLLVPPAPPLPTGVEPGSAAAAAAMAPVLQWVGAHGVWFVAAAAAGAWGTVTVFVLYLDDGAPTLAKALRSAARRWPRFLLFNALVALPAAAGLLLWYVPGLLVLARVLPGGPALVAESRLSAWAAVGRGWTLSRGATLPLMGLVATTLAGSCVLPQPLLMLDAWLRARAGGPNPVALVTVDAAAAAIAAGAGLASAVLAVVAYRRLAR